MDVKPQSGATEEWKLETASSDFLTQHDMKENSFAKGETVTVNGYRATNGSRMVSARVITMKGRAMQVCDPQEDGGPAK
jgi:hypothetical protein